jgi:hypothetical protein
MVALWIVLVTLFKWEAALAVLAPLWMGAAIVGRIRLIRWLCPRCGQPYFAKRWYNNEWADNCVHCKLGKWK